jgi:hypothetical protein
LCREAGVPIVSNLHKPSQSIAAWRSSRIRSRQNIDGVETKVNTDAH